MDEVFPIAKFDVKHDRTFDCFTVTVEVTEPTRTFVFSASKDQMQEMISKLETQLRE